MTSRVNRELTRCVPVLVTSIRILNDRRCPVDSGPSTRLFLLYIQSLSLESGVDEVYVSFGDLNQDLESEDTRSREESSQSSSSIFRKLVRACGLRHCWSFFSSIAAVIYLTPQSISPGFYLRSDVVCGGFRPIFWSPLSARCGGGARDGARRIYVPASFHSSRLLKARWENLRYFPCFFFFWCRIYGLCRSRCCMPWVVLSFMWISSEVMNWFVGLFLFGFCFPLHLFVGEISPSFACVPVFVVRLSKRNAVLLSSSSCSSFPVCRRSPVSAW